MDGRTGERIAFSASAGHDEMRPEPPVSKRGDSPPFSFLRQSAPVTVSAGMPPRRQERIFTAWRCAEKNTIFPRTLGRAALFRQLAFCPSQRQNILKPAEARPHLYGQGMGRSQQEGDEAFYVVSGGPSYGGQAHCGITGFRVVEYRRAHGQDVERILFK